MVTSVGRIVDLAARASSYSRSAADRVYLAGRGSNRLSDRRAHYETRDNSPVRRTFGDIATVDSKLNECGQCVLVRNKRRLRQGAHDFLRQVHIIRVGRKASVTIIFASDAPRFET